MLFRFITIIAMIDKIIPNIGNNSMVSPNSITDKIVGINTPSFIKVADTDTPFFPTDF